MLVSTYPGLLGKFYSITTYPVQETLLLDLRELWWETHALILWNALPPVNMGHQCINMSFYTTTDTTLKMIMICFGHLAFSGIIPPSA